MNGENHLSWSCDAHTSGDIYRQRFAGTVGGLIVARQNALILSLLGGVRGRTVLDVGAGHGQLAGALLDFGGSVTAYGSSAAALSRLVPLGIPLVTGPLAPLPFPDRSFDVVVSVRTFPHVPDWRFFLSELCRVGREAVAFDFVTRDLMRMLKPLAYRLKMKHEPGTRDYAMQGKRDVMGAACACGFRWKAAEGQFILPLVLHRKAGRPILMPVENLARLLRLTRHFGGPVVAVIERKP
ncbi:MAG: class I SAM-dependent methyltransferase [Chlamydiota bacterium]